MTARARETASSGTIRSHHTGILLAGSSGHRLQGNEIDAVSGIGIRIYIGSHNELVGNTVTSLLPARGRRIDYPSGPFYPVGVPTPINITGGTEAQDTGYLVSVVLGDRVLQVRNTEPGSGVRRFRASAGNLVQGNILGSAPVTAPAEGETFQRAGIDQFLTVHDSLIRGNVVHDVYGGIIDAPGGVVGLGARLVDNTLRTCSADPGRLCVRDADCNLPGTAPVGTCPALAEAHKITVTADNGFSRGSVIQGNVVTGRGAAVTTFPGVFVNGTPDMRVSGNFVSLFGEGIRDGMRGIPSSAAEVTRNVVTGNGIGMRKGQGYVLPHGARVHLNDVYGNGVNLVVAPVAMELSHRAAATTGDATPVPGSTRPSTS
jgi:parallel beta-helix repeat protein